MATTTTPMMTQYMGIRRSLPGDTILLFRLGDFYEMFFEDAKVAAPILNVALTQRNGTPMCGMPFHAAEGYIAKLVNAGKRVAICDQTSEPQPGKIVQREVTHIVSPGTVSDLQMLDSSRNNFLAAIHSGAKHGYGFAFIDLSTGEFRVTQLSNSRELHDELARVQPSEILIAESARHEFESLKGLVGKDDYAFLHDQAYHTLREQFGVQSLHGFGCEEIPLGVCAAGAIVHYLRHELRRTLGHVSKLSTYHRAQYMLLDSTTQANLELVESRGGGRNTSLLGALDRTSTPMGARRLREWILHPLCSLDPLLERQSAIGSLTHDAYHLSKVREIMRDIRDIERTVGRLSQAGGNARDLVVLRCAIEQIPELKETVLKISTASSDRLLTEVAEGLHTLPALADLLQKALVDEPPSTTRDGGMFRDGYLQTLDELRDAGNQGKKWIAELQQKAIEQTGIKSLKIRFTSVFGYFIEVTKSNLDAVPTEWTRKQTVATRSASSRPN